MVYFMQNKTQTGLIVVISSMPPGAMGKKNFYTMAPGGVEDIIFHSTSTVMLILLQVTGLFSSRVWLNFLQSNVGLTQAEACTDLYCSFMLSDLLAINRSSPIYCIQFNLCGGF
jgi:hypothetical protein